MKNSTKLINRIKSEGVEPIPKWKFVSKNWFIWSCFTISLLLGALAFSVILYSIQQTDFVLLNHMSHSTIEFILGVLPFFWLISLLIFLIVAFYLIQYSKKAYKFTVSKLVGLNTIMSIILGTIFFIGGGAGKLEQAFASNLNIYEGLELKKAKIWNNPSEGLLSGTIKTVQETNFILIDNNNTEWMINYESAWIAPIIEINPETRIKMIGKITSDHVFNAEEIRPWGGRGMHKNIRNKKANSGNSNQ